MAAAFLAMKLITARMERPKPVLHSFLGLEAVIADVY